jgi:hypothetical protein
MRLPKKMFFYLIGPTQKWTEGRIPLWSSEFTTKDADYTCAICAVVVRAALSSLEQLNLPGTAIGPLRISEYRKAILLTCGR